MKLSLTQTSYLAIAVFISVAVPALVHTLLPNPTLFLGMAIFAVVFTILLSAVYFVRNPLLKVGFILAAVPLVRDAILVLPGVSKDLPYTGTTFMAAATGSIFLLFYLLAYMHALRNLKNEFWSAWRSPHLFLSSCVNSCLEIVSNLKRGCDETITQ